MSGEGGSGQRGPGQGFSNSDVHTNQPLMVFDSEASQGLKIRCFQQAPRGAEVRITL